MRRVINKTPSERMYFMISKTKLSTIRYHRFVAPHKSTKMCMWVTLGNLLFCFHSFVNITSINSRNPFAQDTLSVFFRWECNWFNWWSDFLLIDDYNLCLLLASNQQYLCFCDDFFYINYFLKSDVMIYFHQVQ